MTKGALYHHFGGNPDARDQYTGAPWFDLAARFADDYDQTAAPNNAIRLLEALVRAYQFDANDDFRAGVIALRDTCFGQDGAALANAVRRIIVRSPGNDGVRQIRYGRLEFLERDGVIP